MREDSDCVFCLASTCCVIGKPIDNIDVTVSVRGMSDMVHRKIVPLPVILCADRFAEVFDRYGSRRQVGQFISTCVFAVDIGCDRGNLDRHNDIVFKHEWISGTAVTFFCPVFFDDETGRMQLPLIIAPVT